MGWQWHQLDHMQIICTSLQTDNHASTSSLNFYRLDALPDAQQTVSKHWRQLCVDIKTVQFYWAVQIVAKSFWLPTPTRNAQNAPSRLWSTGPCICWVDKTWDWRDCWWCEGLLAGGTTYGRIGLWKYSPSPGATEPEDQWQSQTPSSVSGPVLEVAVCLLSRQLLCQRHSQ